MNRQELETIAQNAPQFDSEGKYGAYDPNDPSTKDNSIYSGRTNDERRLLAYFRAPMTEAPKCGAFFTNSMADCDPGMGSHTCAADDNPVLGFLTEEMGR